MQQPDITANSIRLHWQSAEQTFGTETGFVITFKGKDYPTSKHEYLFEKLEPATQYEFVIKSKNAQNDAKKGGGLGEPQPFTYTTKPKGESSAPLPPPQWSQ